MSQGELPRQVVEQRVRNRLIEWLETLVTHAADLPSTDIDEILNQWEDWNPPGSSYWTPAYTQSEAEKLLRVAEAWEDFCKTTPTRVSNVHLARPQWNKLMSAAQLALLELQRRGRLCEEIAVEDTSPAA